MTPSTSLDPHALESVFDQDGAIASQVEGYTSRSDQLVLAKAIRTALNDHTCLVAEAGTGTGKTFAYLVPALLSKGPVIISTGTKTLQDQLFMRDIPVIRNVLKKPVTIALLKGRSNYLCHTRLEREYLRDRHSSNQDVHYLELIRAWREQTSTGDLSELTSVPEDAMIRSRVCSHPDICLGSECDHFGKCYLAQARDDAKEADIVVVNHHLLFADMALKDDGFGELLPEATAYIIDEAHQIPEVAAQFFGFSCSSRQISDFLDEVRLACRLAQLDLTAINELVQIISDELYELVKLLGREDQRATLGPELAEPVAEHLSKIADEIKELISVIKQHSDASKAMTGLIERSDNLCKLIHQFDTLPKADEVRWFETFRRGFVLRQTPLNIASQFSKHLAKTEAAWIFTSATLAVNGVFDHFSRELGLIEPVTLCLGSPFDYADHARLYLPKGFPEPGADVYTDKVIRLAELLMEASKARVFMLFTSHWALKKAAEVLREKLSWPMFVQGDMPRMELLKQFQESGDGVLLGTTSFWEGVDVRGPALSLVIIDKLPFASPSDPVMQARRKWLEEQGRNPFMEMQVPQAAIKLKQGVGRLIRDEQDRGMLVICDPRLTKKRYGSIFLDSLPPMTRLTAYQEAIQFLKTL